MTKRRLSPFGEQGYRNWLNRRARQRGRRPLPDRIKDQFGGLPVYRDRINPATGRPHRYDKAIGRGLDRHLDAVKTRRKWPDSYRSGPPVHRPDRPDRADRAKRNQQSVRETLARRQPQFAETLARADQDPRLLDELRARRATRPGRSLR